MTTTLLTRTWFQVALQDGQEVKILLSVVRAYDVPVRSESDPLQSTSKLQSSEAASPTESVVCSYVEAKFQGRSSRTTAAPGPNPAWNQLLTLTFTSLNNDFSPETMNRVRDSLHIHLFDEVGALHSMHDACMRRVEFVLTMRSIMVALGMSTRYRCTTYVLAAQAQKLILGIFA